ncbi:hypothetical protein HZB90_01980, partial [archaeon]|nr:hypothetical protein [archaeon]
VRSLKPKGKPLRITASRTDKDFTKKTQKMDVLLGSAVVDEFGLKVNLHNPDMEIGVEIHNKTFIFHEKIACFGGLPLGITGKVVSFLRDENDVAAAWLMMRRGCFVFPVAFKRFDISLLDNYCYGQNLSLSLVKDFQEAEEFALKNRCKAFVVGDTLADFGKSDYSAVALPVLFPLITYTDDELSLLLKRIR